MRLGWPGIVEFKTDEAALSTLAYDFAHGQGLPLLGIQSSVGLPNPPMSVYLMAIPYRLSADPILATRFVGLLNLMAVMLLFWLAWRYYGLVAGIVAGVLYAVDPWAILYSRKIWEQNLLPLFVIAFIATGLLGLIEGKRWAQWLILPLLAICGQLHYGAFILIPVIIWLIVSGIHRKQIRRAFLGGLIVAILLTIPYLIGLAQSGLFDPSHVRSALSTADSGQPKASLTLTSEGLINAGIVVSGAQIYSLAGDTWQDFLHAMPIADSAVLPDLILAALFLSTGWLCLRTLRARRDGDTRKNRRPIDITLLLWLIVTPLAYSIRWTPVFTHYYIAMIPGAFLIIGVAASDLWNGLRARLNWQRIVGIAGGATLIGVATIEMAIFIALLGFVDTHPGNFGVPLHDLMPMRQRALDSGTPAVIAALDGQDVPGSPNATVWNALFAPIPDVRFSDPQTTVYPLNRTPIFSDLCQDAAGNVRLLAGDPTCFTLINRARAAFDFEHYQLILPTRAHPSIQFSNKAYLIGYQWSISGSNCLNLVWGVSDTLTMTTAPNYFFSVHFTDSQNREIAIADGLSWETRYWRPGDLIVRQYCVADAAKATAITGVRIGMYTNDSGHLVNINLVDQRGTSVAPFDQLYFTPMF